MTTTHTTRLVAATGMSAGLLLASAGAVLAANGEGEGNAAEHVTICHALGTPDDAGNGYNEISPSEQGVISGHANWDHKTHEVSDNGHAADIIPSFTYTDNKGVEHTFPGQNLDDEGQAILDNGCVVPEPTEPEPTQPEPTEPEPTEPEPTEPEPTQPEPTQPEPTQPEPTEEPPAETPPAETPSAETPSAETPPAETPATPETPTVVQTDGWATAAQDDSVLGMLGLAALLGGGAAVVIVGARTAARRD